MSFQYDERPYRVELLPGVGPGPQVGLVVSQTHRHQLVSTVIEYRPGEWKTTGIDSTGN